MPRNGLIITPNLVASNVTSLDLHFSPSMGIMARRVDKLGLDIRSFREPLKRAVKQVMIPSIRKNFDAGGRPKWPRLERTTLDRRAEEGWGGSSPLIRSGRLRRQMGYLKIWHIDKEKALIADLPDSVWYGKVHQAGYGGTVTSTLRNIATGRTETITEVGEGGIPQRRFVMVQRQDEIRIDKVFNDWLGERVRAAGLR